MSEDRSSVWFGISEDSKDSSMVWSGNAGGDEKSETKTTSGEELEKVTLKRKREDESNDLTSSANFSKSIKVEPIDCMDPLGIYNVSIEDIDQIDGENLIKDIKVEPVDEEKPKLEHATSCSKCNILLKKFPSQNVSKIHKNMHFEREQSVNDEKNGETNISKNKQIDKDRKYTIAEDQAIYALSNFLHTKYSRGDKNISKIISNHMEGRDEDGIQKRLSNVIYKNNFLFTKPTLLFEIVLERENENKTKDLKKMITILTQSNMIADKDFQNFTYLTVLKCKTPNGPSCVNNHPDVSIRIQYDSNTDLGIDESLLFAFLHKNVPTDLKMPEDLTHFISFLINSGISFHGLINKEETEELIYEQYIKSEEDTSKRIYTDPVPSEQILETGSNNMKTKYGSLEKRKYKKRKIKNFENAEESFPDLDDRIQEIESILPTLRTPEEKHELDIFKRRKGSRIFSKNQSEEKKEERKLYNMVWKANQKIRGKELAKLKYGTEKPDAFNMQIALKVAQGNPLSHDDLDMEKEKQKEILRAKQEKDNKQMDNYIRIMESFDNPDPLVFNKDEGNSFTSTNRNKDSRKYTIDEDQAIYALSNFLYTKYKYKKGDRNIGKIISGHIEGRDENDIQQRLENVISKNNFLYAKPTLLFEIELEHKNEDTAKMITMLTQSACYLKQYSMIAEKDFQNFTYMNILKCKTSNGSPCIHNHPEISIKMQYDSNTDLGIDESLLFNFLQKNVPTGFKMVSDLAKFKSFMVKSGISFHGCIKKEEEIDCQPHIKSEDVSFEEKEELGYEPNIKLEVQEELIYVPEPEPLEQINTIDALNSRIREIESKLRKLRTPGEKLELHNLKGRIRCIKKFGISGIKKYPNLFKKDFCHFPF